MLPSVRSITAMVASPLRVAPAKPERSVRVPVSCAGGGHGAAVVVRRVQDETQVVRELLDLIVQLRQEQVAGLEQALQPAAAQAARDQLGASGVASFCSSGVRLARTPLDTSWMPAVGSIGWPVAGSI